jgi:DNA-directed RNA polymerase specialized sigma subunit
VDEIELEDRLSLPDLLEGLGELERQAVVMRFFQSLKQNQIGTELSYFQMHISRLLRRARAASGLSFGGGRQLGSPTDRSNPDGS